MFLSFKLNAQKFFVITGLLWGLIFIFINPPIQAPDEDAHLIKMWGILNGSFNFKVENNNKGQIIPKSFAYFVNEANLMKFNYSVKTRKDDLIKLKNIPLEKNNKVFYKQVPASYTIISYIPLIFIVAILKFLNTAPLLMFYILRFCCLLIYLAIAYQAIKITPYKKWLFAILALLPTNLYIASAINTDCLVISIAFFITAYTFYLKFDENIKQITNRQILIWCALFTYLCILKYLYFPLFLMFFLLPKEKFSSNKKYYSIFISLLIINAVYIFFFLLRIISLSKIGIDLYDEHKVDKLELIKHVFISFPHFIKIVFISTIAKMKDMFYGAIGQFGWAPFYLSLKTTFLFYILILLSSLFENSEKFIFSNQDKLISISGIILTYFLIMISLFLIYTTYPIIHGFQGRYGSPYIVLLFIALFSGKINLTNKFLPYIMFFALQFLLYDAAQTIIQRFYF